MKPGSHGGGHTEGHSVESEASSPQRAQQNNPGSLVSALQAATRSILTKFAVEAQWGLAAEGRQEGGWRRNELSGQCQHSFDGPPHGWMQARLL